MNKVLLITGASKGIGLATASRFIDAGYKVVNVSRSACEAPGAINLSVDLLESDWLERHAESVLNAVGEAEQLVLVHNAAMMTKETVATLQAQVLREVFELNVVASAQLNALLLPLMKPDSSIIYISSTLGYQGGC